MLRLFGAIILAALIARPASAAPDPEASEHEEREDRTGAPEHEGPSALRESGEHGESLSSGFSADYRPRR